MQNKLNVRIVFCLSSGNAVDVDKAKILPSRKGYTNTVKPGHMATSIQCEPLLSVRRLGLPIAFTQN